MLAQVNAACSPTWMGLRSQEVGVGEGSTPGGQGVACDTVSAQGKFPNSIT